MKERASERTAPMVSVIIPAYNAKRYVLEAIDSVLAQDYSPIEILVIDDGSIDGTGQFVSEQRPQVRVVSRQNGGVAEARNTGLNNASGDLITFLDADDGWFPGKLKAQVAYMNAHPEVGLVFHRWSIWEPLPDGTFLPQSVPEAPVDRMATVPSRTGWLYSRLLFDCLVHTSTVMIRKEIVESVGYFEKNLINGEDYDFWLRASRQAEIHQLDAVYSFYRAAPGSLTSSVKPINYEYAVISRAIDRWGYADPDGTFANHKAVERRLSLLATDFGYLQYHQGDPILALSSYWRGLTHFPWSPNTWRYLIFSAMKCIYSRLGFKKHSAPE